MTTRLGDRPPTCDECSHVALDELSEAVRGLLVVIAGTPIASAGARDLLQEQVHVVRAILNRLTPAEGSNA